ncbi:hypothetical protein HMI54_014563 [Coelomomyces lativittatus]|nr:hypothetical protein HMI54_014563 [Coelomomyces lativittatus]
MEMQKEKKKETTPVLERTKKSYHVTVVCWFLFVSIRRAYGFKEKKKKKSEFLSAVVSVKQNGKMKLQCFIYPKEIYYSEKNGKVMEGIKSEPYSNDDITFTRNTFLV